MDKAKLYEELMKRTGLPNYQIVSAYQYGSRVYGTARKNSDWDFVIVADNRPKDREQYSDNLINVNFYTLDEHQRRIKEHEPSALECQFLPQEFIIKETYKPAFNLDLDKLRNAFSAKASNSWVKAKKKLTVEKDYNDLVGKKSLWHSLRIIDFGTQIANWNEIRFYGSMNHLYDEILYCADWTEMYDKYKLMFNEMSSKFRLVAPKVK